MNWKFWFFGKAAGNSKPAHNHDTTVTKTAAQPTQIVATLSEEDKAMFKLQHEQVLSKIDEAKHPNTNHVDAIEIRKARMHEMTKILLCFAAACCVVPHWMTTGTLTAEIIPFAAFIGTASITGLTMIASYLLRDAECIVILQPDQEDVNETEFSYRVIWRNLPCFIFLAFICLTVHMIAIACGATNPILESKTLTWINLTIYIIMGIYSVVESIRIVQLFLKTYRSDSKFSAIICPVARVIWGYAFLTLFLSSAIK